MRTLSFVALVFAMVSSSAAADTSPVNPVLAQARRSYATGDYLSAIRLLERGLASGHGFTDVAARDEARLYLSAAYFATGDRDAAQRILTSLFTDSPDAKVPTELFPPPFIGLVDRARAEAAALAKPPLAPVELPHAVTPIPPVPQPRADVAPLAPVPLRPSGPRLYWWPVGLGLAAAAGGAASLFIARANHFQLVTSPVDGNDVITTARGQQLAAAGAATQITGWSLVGAGAAAVISGLMWFLLGGGS